jgi:S1-C subfamily serine protease
MQPSLGFFGDLRNTGGSQMETISETNISLQALSHDLAHVVEHVSTAVVAINARRHLSSSGVYWREGVVVTAAHTIRQTEGISVVLATGQSIAASVAGVDPTADLAALRLDGVELSPPPFGDTSQLKIGHLVLAVGRGIQRGVNATLGIVGVLTGPWRTWRGALVDQFIGLDLELHPGAAGGPLTDSSGRVLGINTLGLSRRMALTIPVSTVNRVVGQLLEKGQIGRGYLGLGLRSIPIPEDLRGTLHHSADSGLIVVSVEPDGPGSKAGVLFGDVIVALEGTAVNNIRDLQAFLEPESVGKTLSVSIIRSGKLVEVNVTVGERRRRSD